jgi:hypothetical protein
VKFVVVTQKKTKRNENSDFFAEFFLEKIENVGLLYDP